jgi:hypothetical protein
MVLLAGEELYVSHLPLYQAPHDYQVIVRVGTERATHDRILDLARTAPNGLLTIEPERFDLLRLQPGHQEPLSGFSAAVYTGHFERSGQKALTGVRFTIKNVILFRRLAADMDKPKRAPYLLFGDAGAQYAAHVIGGRPDFDQLLAVSVGAAALGTVVNVDIENAIDPARALDKRMVTAGTGTATWSLGKARTLYLETADLSN